MTASQKPDANKPGRVLTVLAAIMGSGGVAAAAYAAHGSAERMASAVALILLAHAPAILAIALFGGRNRILMLGGFLIAGGALLFSADLGLRMFSGMRLFSNAAPAAGMAMMAGWLVTGISAFAGWRRHQDH